MTDTTQTDTVDELPLGNIIGSPKIRKIVYGTYALAAIAAGGAAAYFLGIHHPLPDAVTGAQAVLAYLAIPVGGLAVANVN